MNAVALAGFSLPIGDHVGRPLLRSAAHAVHWPSTLQDGRTMSPRLSALLLIVALMFGVKGRNARTLPPGRRQVNFLATRKREHSRKPDEQYAIIEACSPGPYLELFARGTRAGWTSWGNQADEGYRPTWETYAHHSSAAARLSSPRE